MLTVSFGGTPYFEGLDHLFDSFLTTLSIVRSLLFLFSCNFSLSAFPHFEIKKKKKKKKKPF
jgi:hypothetical protein